MFLSGALAAIAEREESFDEQADIEAGIDFAMEAEGEEEALEMAGATAEVDISIEETKETPMMEPPEETDDFAIEVEAEAEASPEKPEKTFEEIDFMGPIDEEDEGTLEFDLEDFIDDLDDDKSKK
jgi:hypothetical protein